MQLAVPDHWIEGINRHAFDRHRVHVRFKHDAPGGIASWDASDHVVASREHFLLTCFDASLLKKVLHIGRRFCFARAAFIGAVDAVDAHKFRESL